MERAETLIVGGGIAGAALAYHLAAGGARNAEVRLVERAPAAGAHASGRNARLVLQAVPEPLLRRLTADSARIFAARAAEMGFHRVGSLLLGNAASFVGRRDAALFASHEVGDGEVRARVPWLAPETVATALETPGDGVLDPQRLLAFYLDGARRGGARVDFDVTVTAIAGRGPFRVDTTAGPLLAERLVDAAGAWACEIAAGAGAAPLPLVAYKRHLFILDAALPAELPYVWDLARDAYFRHDAEGALACWCDEEPTVALAETVTPTAEAVLRERLGEWVPALASAPLVRAWSCFRTKAPDALP
ncbi:MAG TPA: FAD-dependent oxidoreductase, partial [Thermoanaerobaculia bacterium]|nr:FAD-dependent oxidoreductase [Thermoanaerobaculia bacterium]